jgi:hypothetical protein
MPELKAYRNYYLWDYVPSLPTAIVATLLFCITTAAVLYRSISTRTRFAIPFIVGGFCMFPSTNSSLYKRVSDL